MRATGTFLTRGRSYFWTLRRQLLLFINQIVANCLFLLLILIVLVVEKLLTVLLSETAAPLYIKSPILYFIGVIGLSICCFKVLLGKH